MLHIVACVQFDSENYSISSLNLSLTVTLTLSGQAQTEPFDVFVIAKDTLSADCMLILLVILPLSKVLTIFLQQMILLLDGIELHLNLDLQMLQLMEFQYRLIHWMNQLNNLVLSSTFLVQAIKLA